MTYKQLATLINNMPEAHQSLDVSVYCHNFDEFFPAAEIKVSDDSQDALDIGHPFITLNKGFFN